MSERRSCAQASRGQWAKCWQTAERLSLVRRTRRAPYTCGCTCTQPNIMVSVKSVSSLDRMPFKTSWRSLTQSFLRQTTTWANALRKAICPSTLKTKVGMQARRACTQTSVSVAISKPITEGMILFNITRLLILG